MADGRHLEKMKNCNISTTDWRILTKFCMTVHLYSLQPVTNRRALEHRDATPCKISSKSVNPLRRYRDFSFFQDGGRRHVGFLKFSIWKFEFFTRLAWKRQFTPKNWGFGGNWSPLRLCCGYRPASDKLSNDLISTQSHNKLKHGLFTTIISPYNSLVQSCQNLCWKCAPRTRTQVLWHHHIGISNRLVKLRSLVDQTSFEFIDVSYFGTMESYAGESLPLQNSWCQWIQTSLIDEWAQFDQLPLSVNGVVV